MGVTVVRRKDEAEVYTWSFGEDPPEGYKVVQNSDGSRSAVRYDDRNEIARDSEGSAFAIPEGGALIVHPNGNAETVPAKVIPKPIAQPDGGVNWTTELANNEDGLKAALTTAGYDASGLDEETPDAGDPVAEDVTPDDETVDPSRQGPGSDGTTGPQASPATGDPFGQGV